MRLLKSLYERTHEEKDKVEEQVKSLIEEGKESAKSMYVASEVQTIGMRIRLDEMSNLVRNLLGEGEDGKKFEVRYDEVNEEILLLNNAMWIRHSFGSSGKKEELQGILLKYAIPFCTCTKWVLSMKELWQEKEKMIVMKECGCPHIKEMLSEGFLSYHRHPEGATIFPSKAIGDCLPKYLGDYKAENIGALDMNVTKKFEVFPVQYMWSLIRQQLRAGIKQELLSLKSGMFPSGTKVLTKKELGEIMETRKSKSTIQVEGSISCSVKGSAKYAISGILDVASGKLFLETCTCPSHRFKKGGEKCKHLLMMEALQTPVFDTLTEIKINGRTYNYILEKP